jgi:hypothetical protein
VAAGKPDWEQIRTEYITTKITYEKLAKKYSVPYGTLKDRAQREKWFTAKKKTQEKVVRNAVKKIASRKASRIIKELDPALLAAEKINQLVLDTLTDDKQFRRHLVQVREKEGGQDGFSEKWDVEEREFDVVDTKRLRDLAAALKISKELQRLLEGLVDPAQEQKLAVERERLELEKKKTEKDIASGDVKIVLEGELDEWAR